jgi:uncharacterized protein
MRQAGPQHPDLVDAVVGAAGGIAWQRHFNLDQLSRLQEAGALVGTEIDVKLSSAHRDGNLELEGMLWGRLILTCQRCLQPAEFALNESIALRVVRTEALAVDDESEYVIADPTRLDLRWLSEEQALLAMPLVPMHEPEVCPQGHLLAADEMEEAEPNTAQSPFANLRDMLKKR